MNELSREEMMAFIFETGRAFRFHMDQHVLTGEFPTDPICTDLTAIQTRATLQVWLRQPLSLNELAKILQVTPSAASALVDKLVEKEVLTREPDPRDRRRVVIRVHKRAEEAMNSVNEQFLKAFRSIADAIPDESLHHWHEAMRSVAAVLQQKNTP